MGRRLIEVLSMKGWNKNGLDPLLRNVHATGAVDRQPGSERPRFERTAENIANVCIHLTYFAEDENEIINHSFQILIICKKTLNLKITCSTVIGQSSQDTNFTFHKIV